MATVMRGWQWYNSNIYTPRVNCPFDVWDAVVEMCFAITWNSLVSIYSIKVFHVDCCFFLKKICLLSRSLPLCAYWAQLCLQPPKCMESRCWNSSWDPHPWLDLAQPAGSGATWHPGWPSRLHLWVVAFRLQLCAASVDVDILERQRPLLTLSVLWSCYLDFKKSMRSFWEGSAAFAEVNFHKSLRLIQLLQLREGGITL